MINGLTDTPARVKKAIPSRGHQKADIGFLAGMSLLTLRSFIKKDKKALGFHLTFLALAAANYMLTDYEAGGSK